MTPGFGPASPALDAPHALGAPHVIDAPPTLATARLRARIADILSSCLACEIAITLLVLASAGLIYWQLHQRYYVSYVDDAWVVSETRHLVETGSAEDYLFRPERAPDRVLVFGGTYLRVYGAFLERAGWTKSNALILSSVFIWLSAGVWFVIVRRLRLSLLAARLIACSMLLFPAYFSAGNLARYDAMVFLLASLSFLAFLYRRYVLAGVLLVVAIESHPMGMAAAFYILTYAIYDRLVTRTIDRPLRVVAWCAAGAFVGGLYVAWLHPDLSVSRLRDVLAVNWRMNGFRYGFIVKYFTEQRWYRHVWELPLIAGAIVVFVRRRMWTRQVFAAIFLPVMIGASFAVGRANANYMVFAYPAFSIFMVVAFEEARLLGRIVPVVVVALLVLYGSIYARDRSFDFDRVTAETRASLADPRLPVVGMPDDWFAVPDRTFFPIYPSAIDVTTAGPREFYLVRNDYISDQSNNYGALLAGVDRSYACAPVRSFPAFRTNVVEVFRCGRRP